MKPINLKKSVAGTLEEVVKKTSDALMAEGFGILTRIDFHSKIREKLGREIRPAVILGACNPQLAYDAYQRNTDIASLIPCNAVVRETGEGIFSVELMKPTAMMEILGDPELVDAACDADARLERALGKIT